MRLCVIVAFLISSALNAQFTVESFRALQTDRNNVLLNWVVSPGNTCADLELQLSTDSINYTTIYVYPGICGNTTSSQSYQFNHTSSECTEKRFYRLTSSSSGVFARTDLNFICYGDDGINVTYNVSTAIISVDADIPPGEQWRFSVYSFTGLTLSSHELTKGRNSVLWNPADSGIYIYTIEAASRQVDSGHLWIMR
jgi:hypothetical protein